jgi:hypothetical protein
LAVSPTSDAAALHGLRAAYQSTAFLDAHQAAKLDAITGNALIAHTLASGDTEATAALELTRHAIRSWRRFAGRDNPVDRPASIDNRRKVVFESEFVPSH